MENNLSEYIKNHPRISSASMVFSYQKELVNNLNLKIIGSEKFAFIKDDLKNIESFLLDNKENIDKYEIFKYSINQATDLFDYENKDYRIEPGAIIREKVHLGNKVVVLMNATINIGAQIGDNSMIDMGAIIGSKAIIGKNCHIGANAVIAGVLEPESKKPVIIEDNVFIGANAVVLEGVTIGKNSLIGAMSLVTKDVPSNSVVMGVPGRIIKEVDDQVTEKCKNNIKLR